MHAPPHRIECWVPLYFKLAECGSAMVDLVFVLDSSESVGLENWKLLLNFVQRLIANAEVDTGRTRIAVETYR